MSELEFLQSVVSYRLYYGLKSPDTDLYEIGLEPTINLDAEKYILHAICRFKVIWKNQQSRVEVFYEDTPCEIFYSAMNHLLGLKIKRIALSSKNDLWIDLGDCWLVFATFENVEESWRLFSPHTNTPHLVASNSWLRLDTRQGQGMGQEDGTRGRFSCHISG